MIFLFFSGDLFINCILGIVPKFLKRCLVHNRVIIFNLTACYFDEFFFNFIILLHCYINFSLYSSFKHIQYLVSSFLSFFLYFESLYFFFFLNFCFCFYNIIQHCTHIDLTYSILHFQLSFKSDSHRRWFLDFF